MILSKDAEHFNSVYNWSWKELKDSPRNDLVDETYSSLFLRSAPDCEDLYTDCAFSGEIVACGDIFKKVVSTRGICCFASATKLNKADKPWSLIFDSKSQPISLDVLENDRSPPVRSTPAWYYLKRGATIAIETELTYSTSRMSGLSEHQRKCLLNDESYNMCMFRCEKKLIYETCGCLPWFLTAWGDYRECTRGEYNCLAKNSFIFKKIFDDCNCYLGCDHTSYVINDVSHQVNSSVQINMLDWPSVVFKRDVLADWLDILVSFGGIAGLFVGYSLLTTVELIYYFSLRSYCGAVLAAPEKIIKVKVSEAPAKQRVVKVIDLKNDYYDYVD